MKRRAGLGILLLAFLLAAGCATTTVSRGMSPAQKRAEIDRMAEATLARLFEVNPQAKVLYDASRGWAVFDNLKLSLFLSGGGGAGVAVDRPTGRRIYMRMATAGLNIGLGGQKYQIVFLFQDEKTFNDFVEIGFKAEAQANAVAGKAGVNAATGFTNGMAVYQLTEAGLMLQADISGTRYWKWAELNGP